MGSGIWTTDDTCLYFLLLGATAGSREGREGPGRTSAEVRQRRGAPRDGRGELEEFLLVRVEDLRERVVGWEFSIVSTHAFGEEGT